MFDPKDITAAREEFGKLAEILDHAMGDEQMNATPHVAAVLHLLSQGLLTLARVVFDAALFDGDG